MKELEQLLVRAEALLARLEPLLPTQTAAPDWQASTAFRWRVSRDGRGRLQGVTHASHISLADLHHVDVQKEQIDQNTRQFVAGKPANNVLLTGARGTGKSSLIKACLNQYANQGQHNVAPGNILHRLLNEFWIASKFTRGMDLQ